MLGTGFEANGLVLTPLPTVSVPADTPTTALDMLTPDPTGLSTFFMLIDGLFSFTRLMDGRFWLYRALCRLERDFYELSLGFDGSFELWTLLLFGW